MTDSAEPATDVMSVAGSARARRWAGFFAVAWLVFLVQPLSTAASLDTTRGWVAFGVMLAFGAAYVVAAGAMRDLVRSVGKQQWAHFRRRTALALSVMLVLAGIAVALVGEPGLGLAPYVAVVGPMLLGRLGMPWVVGCAAVTEVLGRSFHGSWAEPTDLSVSVLLAGSMTWGFMAFMQRQAARLRAVTAEAELAVERERGRFARDLHDILGHSLTTITVKAELAGRLLDVDPDRARTEIADLERLSRDALHDVRRAVTGYRDISLAAELAGAKEVLRAAGIEADLPLSADGVPSERREAFAWAVREGATNVVRHSGARTCRVLLTPDSVTVEDDGAGVTGAAPSVAGGNGLRGLRERATAAGGVLVTEPVEPHGFRLVVSMGGER